ncbi:F0F1 ATP synthase subunit gamma [Parapusillimonas granuli]|uniref:F0F1 ATP synthase subunit gamma n=1 Tax=Parapusillimonas granuli TaxID=380911 RepID=A0A853FTL6_9BURK|nr:FoF1 ATP synthase subunit gamma [Parapusillimonas granuli]MBB5214952.1 F-type H+-transporting ATPase subunit gamma [Parapusillimonas granuli]MEB2401189.1 F0F1 ATP synthase subunit gamma [Alcaligenaceae bacterium]NYT49274.1 F0F1 ATP synthase subunit gamma [Parapusillimonas granuli]
MASLEELSRHIAVAADLKSVVHTMKAISAVSIHRHEQAARTMKQYLANVEHGLQIVLRTRGRGAGPSPAPAGRERVAVVLAGSEIGLCGAFNERLTAFARSHLAAMGVHAGRRLVLTIGARIDAGWRAEAEPPAAHQEAPATVDALTATVGAVLTRLDQWRKDEEVGRLELFFQRQDAGGGTVPAHMPLWPLDQAWLDDVAARPWPSRRLPVVMGDPEAVFRRLVRQLLFARVFTAIIESRTAEHAERLAAMQAADRSIEEKLEELRIAHRLKRQEVITSELLDIVSGYESIVGDA